MLPGSSWIAWKRLSSSKDLAALPGNRLEALKGDRKGQHSIRINDQWRICFEWPGGSPGPANVEIVDYH
jgi:proteic killer suppression protein